MAIELGEVEETSEVLFAFGDAEAFNALRLKLHINRRWLTGGLLSNTQGVDRF